MAVSELKGRIRSILRQIPKGERNVPTCQRALKKAGIEVTDGVVRGNLSAMHRPRKNQSTAVLDRAPATSTPKIDRRLKAYRQQAANGAVPHQQLGSIATQLCDAATFIQRCGGPERAKELVNAVASPELFAAVSVIQG